MQGVSVTADLPDAAGLDVGPECLLPASASFSIEIFAGECSLTMALMLCSVPCLRPWDTLAGERFDVLVNGTVLVALAKARRIGYAALATPCQSQSWGRLPAVQSWEYPLGLPGLGRSQRELVIKGNRLAQFSADFALVVFHSLGYVSIENPRRSWLWWHPAIRGLAATLGFCFVWFHQNWYGTCVKKPTCLLHCLPRLHLLAVLKPSVTKVTVTLRGQVSWRGQPAWRTALASPYPPGLVRPWAALVAESLRLRDQALASSAPVPFASPAHGQDFPLRVPQQFRHLLPFGLHSRQPTSSPSPTSAATSSPASSSSSSALMVSSRASASSSAWISRPFDAWATKLCQAMIAAERALPALGVRQRQWQVCYGDWTGDLESQDGIPALPTAADPFEPYVPYGGGQPRGLATLEQVAWTTSATHPGVLCMDELDADLVEALQFEADREAQEVDLFRAQRLRELLDFAERSQGQREAWVQGAPPSLRPLVALIHGPVLEMLAHVCAHPDKGVIRCLQTGFPFAGPLPAAGVCVRPGMPKPLGRLSVAELRSKRSSFNEAVLGNLKPSQWSADVMEETVNDIKFGAMRGPWLLHEASICDKLLSRRMPVREERSAGWKTRVVDDCSESGINMATQACEKLKSDGADILILMVRALTLKGRRPELWKRDITSAFRRIPIQEDHLDLSFVVFMVDMVVWLAHHVGMPFGTTSAVHSWHRVGSLLSTIARRFFRAPAAKFVDDYFGASVAGVRLTGGHCLDILGSIVGFPTKDVKSVSFASTLQLLGLILAYVHGTLEISIAVDPAKAKKWAAILFEVVHTRRCTQRTAIKMAGRLSFAVHASTGKVGRAYIKPFFAQANAPLPHDRASWQLLQAAAWWIDYFAISPASTIPCGQGARTHVHAWTDAAGTSRWLAAVIHVGGSFWWTRARIPDAVWHQFIPRGDEQIGGQELIAVPLLTGTFRHLLRGAFATIAIDNMGVVGGLIAGRGAADDHNAAIARVWLDFAELSIAPYIIKVETSCNVADGPTREDFSFLNRIGAHWVPPCWPSWISDFWALG